MEQCSNAAVYQLPTTQYPLPDLPTPTAPRRIRAVPSAAVSKSTSNWLLEPTAGVGRSHQGQLLRSLDLIALRGIQEDPSLR